jgi:hypothetical protein
VVFARNCMRIISGSQHVCVGCVDECLATGAVQCVKWVGAATFARVLLIMDAMCGRGWAEGCNAKD